MVVIFFLWAAYIHKTPNLVYFYGEDQHNAVLREMRNNTSNGFP